MQNKSLNKTIKVENLDRSIYTKNLLYYDESTFLSSNIDNKVIIGDLTQVLPNITNVKYNLIIADPPYNLTKTYDNDTFNKQSIDNYKLFTESYIKYINNLLLDNGTFYIFSDWFTSTIIFPILAENFSVLNRITFAREKGRGNTKNFKNNMEDIWFCVKDKNNYYFDVNSIKSKKKVKAPYVDSSQLAKDWEDTPDGKYRLTYPSNIWTDISIPFWSMAENTEHPTQKPEKLLAKLILASSSKGDRVLDLFSGSGTTSVVSKKLDRIYTGIEKSDNYGMLAEKRLELVDNDNSIQGYKDGNFLMNDQ